MVQDRTRDPDATKERYEGDTQERSWDANVKRTYDEEQEISLAASKRSQRELDADGEQRRRHVEEIHNVTLQLLQNAVETANLVSKQAVRHAELAIDRQWNIDEVSHLAAGSVVSVDALLAALAAAVAAEINKAK